MVGKRNGFSCPLHKLQVISWVWAVLQTAGSYVLIYPKLSDLTSVSFLCVFSVSIAATLVFGLLTTLSDPTDPVVYTHQTCIERGLPFDEHRYSLVCTTCQTNVSTRSKHCARCNRCVANFDHHCKWLNNCIGGSNYRLFVTLLWTVECGQAVIVAYGLIVLMDIETGNAEDLTRLVGIAVLLATAGVLFIIILQLILFHIWLRLRGMTTYDYIRTRRKAQVRVKVPEPAPVAVISTLGGGELKPQPVQSPPPEYNLAAELRPVSDEESSYSVSESVLSGVQSVSRQVSSRNELL